MLGEIFFHGIKYSVVRATFIDEQENCRTFFITYKQVLIAITIHIYGQNRFSPGVLHLCRLYAPFAALLFLACLAKSKIATMAVFQSAPSPVYPFKLQFLQASIIFHTLILMVFYGAGAGKIKH